MTMLAPWTEQWQHFRTGIREEFWGDLAQHTRPMVCFVNVQSVERIIYSIFHRFNLQWR